MIILSHRGYWESPEEKNTETAFRRSFSLGFGTETDVRDCMGKLVISHDMPSGMEMTLQALLSLTNGKKLPLAINIKSDGLADLLKYVMTDYERSSWFIFDMSIPDMRAHLKAGNPVFARMSEVEKDPAWLDQIEGIWLDSFDGEWFDRELICNLLEQRKKVCVVSSEIHGRDQTNLWSKLRPLAQEDRLILCTDLPERAQEFFTGVSQ
jgi:hypothetical protein